MEAELTYYDYEKESREKFYTVDFSMLMDFLISFGKDGYVAVPETLIVKFYIGSKELVYEHKF